MDAFFASVEQLDNPSFKGKPLIVGGNPSGRGVVAACSYEAREYGIHSAMPCKRALHLCPAAIFTRPRMDRYKAVSGIVMDIFRQYTDLVEPLSFDEAFLDVTSNFSKEPSATRVADKIREHIYNTTRLTASAGISFNKFLAKVASDINKPDGMKTIPPEDALDFLSSLPIRKFFGVGKVTEKKMLSLGIKNGWDLRQWQEESLVFHFGKVGTFLYNISRAIDNRPVEPSRIRKSIGKETTLQDDTTDLPYIEKTIEHIADKLAVILSNRNSVGHTLTLKIRYDNFETISRSATVAVPLQSREDILQLTPSLLSATQAGLRKVRLIGLSISKLTSKRNIPRQLLLPFIQREKF